MQERKWQIINELLKERVTKLIMNYILSSNEILWLEMYF